MSMMFWLLLYSFNSYSIELSDLELYQRCHSHFTGQSISFNDPNLIEIKTGRMSGINACKTILNSAKISGDLTLNTTNTRGISVLQKFFQIHASWFQDKIFDSEFSSSVDIYELSPGGLSLTKSLFDSSFKFSDIFRGSNVFEGIRTKGSPLKSAARGIASDKFTYIQGTDDTNTVSWSGLNLPEQGLLIGIRPERPVHVTNFRNSTGNKVINGTLGGGILGSRNYILKTARAEGMEADGAIQMPRKWGRAIFKDMLCQDLPVVNFTTDTAPYVDPTSKTPFRTSSGCVACHVSMDQLSGLIRNYNVQSTSSDDSSLTVPIFHNTQTQSPYQWTPNKDSNYFKKTPLGRFLYRTTSGELIDRELQDLNSLGELVVQIDDLYTCTASRYLEYFTGVKVPTAQVISQPKNIYSMEIQKLSKILKDTQSPFNVIELILNSKIYKDSKYLVGE